MLELSKLVGTNTIGNNMADHIKVVYEGFKDNLTTNHYKCKATSNKKRTKKTLEFGDLISVYL